MYNYRARSYDPNTGRFLSEDPLGFGGGDTNNYVYVGNSPTGFVDPLGLTKCVVTSTFGPVCSDWRPGLTWVESKGTPRLPVPMELLEPSSTPCGCRQINQTEDERNKKIAEAIAEFIGTTGGLKGLEHIGEHWGKNWVKRVVPILDVLDSALLEYKLRKIARDAEEQIRRVRVEECLEVIPIEN